MLSDEWLPRYRLLGNFNIKWNGNGNAHGNAYDRGDYNSSFALRAVELKTVVKLLNDEIIPPFQFSEHRLRYCMQKAGTASRRNKVLI